MGRVRIVWYKMEEVFGLAHQGRKIDEKRIRMLLGWRHSGFSAYRGSRIARDDRQGQEDVVQYSTSFETPFRWRK